MYHRAFRVKAEGTVVLGPDWGARGLGVRGGGGVFLGLSSYSAVKALYSWGRRFRAQGLGFRVWGLGFRV